MRLELDLVELGFAAAFHQEVIAGAQLVHQLEVQRLAPEPVLASGHLVDFQLRPILGHKPLEQHVGVFQFLLEFFARRGGVFAEQGEGALVFAGGMQLEIHFVLLEQAIEIGDLRNHTD